MDKEVLRKIPPVNTLLMHPLLKKTDLPRSALVEAIREQLDLIRRKVEIGEQVTLDVDQIAAASIARARHLVDTTPSRVINATGIVLHTNLGRAVLADAAQKAMTAAAGYCDLEFDLDTGERGSRHSHVDELLCKVTGSQAAMAVNNNAGAMLLILTVLASGKEVIVSRGELVEIGGSFRVPDIMRQSGARLVEVGTTNRTRLEDYERAITGATAAILKVHTSNYRMVGFTESVEPGELAGLAKKHGLLLIHDAGSGLLCDLAPFGLCGEPTIQSLVSQGCNIVAFSGDKLFGGPQAGIIVGDAHHIKAMKKHPLARALRLDKVTLAALSATLRIYAYGNPLEEIPVLRMLTEKPETLGERADSMRSRVAEVAPGVSVSVVISESYPGGGSFPGVAIKSPVLAVEVPGMSARTLSQLLRLYRPPIITRIHEGRVLFDPRTLSEDDIAHVVEFFRGLA